MANRLNVEMNLDLTPFEKALGRLQTKLGALSKQMQDAGSTLSQNLTLPILGVGAASVKAFADMEKLNKGLTAIMGSSDMAAEELQKLREVAKLPGLGLKEAVQGSINLQAVGLSADEARSTLFGFGKALAAVGKGKFELEAIQYQLTQMISKNKLLAEDYKVIQSNLPLMAAGMEAAFGTNNIEAIRETGISAKEFTLRLSEALAKLPQTQNVTGGLANAFENFSDNIFIAASELGAMISEALNLEGVLGTLTKAVENTIGFLKSLSPQAQKVIVIFAAMLAGIGPLLFALGAFAKVWGVMLTGFKSIVSLGPKIAAAWTFISGPIGITIGAIVGLVAVLVILYKRFENVRRVINGLGMAFVEVGKFAKESFTALLEGFAKLKEGDLRGAAQSFGTALSGLNFIEYGKRAALGFAEGFEDTTDYLSPAIENIKKQVKQAQSAFGLSTFTPLDITTPTGGGGGGKTEPKIDTKALEAQEKAISNITSNISKLAQTAKGPFGFVRAELSKITVLTPELNKQKDALLEYQKAILQVSNRAAIFGENPLDAQLRATESALSSALETFGPYSEAVRVLADEYDRLKEAVNDNKLATEQANKEQQFAIELQNVFASAFQAGANAIANAGKGVTEALRAVGRAALQAAGDVLRAKIIEGVASVVADSLKKFGLVGLAVAAGAGAAAGALFQSTIGRITTPKLAKGGLAFGQTMAVVGDNPGARTDPEVIAPLSKLKDYLNPAGGAFVAEARISGTDLLILVNNADRANKRVR